MITTIQLPTEFYRVKSGTFRQVPVQSLYLSGFVPNAPRSGGARFLRWVCDVQFTRLAREQWQKYEAFIALLSDRPYAFTLYDPSKILPLGVGAGFSKTGEAYHWLDPSGLTQHFDDGHWRDGATFCKVKSAADRQANSIVVEGLPVSSVILKTGDNFSVGGNLYMASGDVQSDASGDARINFVWRLHKSVSASDLVDFHKPRGRFVLVDPSSGGVMKSTSTNGDANLKAIEVPFT